MGISRANVMREVAFHGELMFQSAQQSLPCEGPKGKHFVW